MQLLKNIFAPPCAGCKLESRVPDVGRQRRVLVASPRPGVAPATAPVHAFISPPVSAPRCCAAHCALMLNNTTIHTDTLTSYLLLLSYLSTYH